MTGMEFYFTPKGEVMIIDECGTRQLEQSNREFISEIITRMGIFLARSTGESIIGIYRPTV